MIPSRLPGNCFNPRKIAALRGWRVSLKSWAGGSIPWHRCVRLRRVTRGTATSHPIQLSETSARDLQRFMLRGSALSSWISTLFRNWKPPFDFGERSEIYNKILWEYNDQLFKHVMEPKKGS
jgi:uncharacterized protein (UPF0248 family)